MADEHKKLSAGEIVALVVSAIGGLGSALGAVFAALQYTPNHTTEILIGSLVGVSLLAFGFNTIFGGSSLISKSSMGLAMTFIATLVAVVIVPALTRVANAGPPVPPPKAVLHEFEIHAEDGATLDPINPKLLRNFKIVVVNNNDTRTRIIPDDGVTQIDLSRVKTISITACNVTTEYNVQSLKDTEKQLSLPVTFVVTAKSGNNCIDRTK